MNPFEKRDKIPRTPPGLSFYERSFVALDQSLIADCSLYDESGMRVLDPSTDLKRYTLTFNDDSVKNSLLITGEPRIPLSEFDRQAKVSVFPRISSLQNRQSQQLCASSPLLSKYVSPEHLRDPIATPATVLANHPEDVVPDKENTEQNTDHRSPFSVQPSVGRKRSGKSRPQHSDLDTDASSSLVPSPPVTVRRLRFRTVTREEMDGAVDASTCFPRGKRKRANAEGSMTDTSSASDSHNSSVPESGHITRVSSKGRARRTTRKHRVIAVAALESDQPSSSSSPSEAVTPHRNADRTPLETPVTVVAKPRHRVMPVTDEVQPIAVPHEPVTVRRRGTTIRSRRSRSGTAAQSPLSVIEKPVGLDVTAESVTRTVQHRKRPSLHSVSSSTGMTLDTLDISAITPVPSKRARIKRKAVDTTVLRMSLLLLVFGGILVRFLTWNQR